MGGLNFTLADLPKLAYQVKLSKYTALVGATIWIWDILLTMNEELELLWARNGWLVKTLYLINRYLPVAGVTLFMKAEFEPSKKASSKLGCQISWSLIIFCFVVQVIVSTSLFVMRLCAVYVMRPIIRKGLIFFLLLSHVAMTVILAYCVYTLLPGVIWESLLFNICLNPDYSDSPTGIGYATPLIIETVVFLATVYHAIDYNGRYQGLRNNRTSEVLRTLYVNGAMYYLIVISIRIGSVLVFYLAPVGLQVLLIYSDYALCSTLTSRLFLSFRRKVIESQSHISGFSSTDPSSYRLDETRYGGKRSGQFTNSAQTGSRRVDAIP